MEGWDDMTIAPPPPKLEDYRAGHTLVAGLGHSTILPDMDFETYSPAGFEWNSHINKFERPNGASVKGLPVVGTAKYSEHPEAEVLCLAYDLKDGKGRRLWTPQYMLGKYHHNPETDPFDLWDHVRRGGLIESWNVAFEYWIWQNICTAKYGFPPLNPLQLRCAAAKSRAHALPGSLEKAGEVTNVLNQKDKDGRRLINKFCIPRNPTKNNESLRTLPSDDPDDAQNLYNYCLKDIQAESEISSLIPDLSPDELEFWQCDHAINVRGVQVDVPLIHNCISILEQAYDKYDQELCRITNGLVQYASELPKLKEWLRQQMIPIDKLRADDLEDLIKAVPDNRPEVKRALEIRSMCGSASVKKLYSMANQVTKDNRLHDLFLYHAARTGRASGNGPQPQNLPNSGPDVFKCQCGKHYLNRLEKCPWCGIGKFIVTKVNECGDCGGSVETDPTYKKVEWNAKAVDDAVEILSTGCLPLVEYYFNDAIELISSCLRGMFISAPGKDLICSDYSAIEAVVLAALSGEQWRLDVFNTHGKIYEMSASKICNIDFDEFDLHKSQTGSHHPARKLGKVAELASGYQGWVGGWRAFGADEFFSSEEEMKEAILNWRAASPMIVKFWSEIEKSATAAVMNPGQEFSYRNISYICKQDVLYCRLLSGRLITYHKPLISANLYGKNSLSFEGWNSNPKYGKTGWVRMDTYGGKLTENIVQATARDLLAYAIVHLEKSGYQVVLHVHDEIVVEVPEGWGSVEEVERIMSAMPSWATGWPVKAKGGWRAKRYNK